MQRLSTFATLVVLGAGCVRTSTVATVPTLLHVTAENGDAWSVRRASGERICETPCDVRVATGEGAIVERANERLRIEIPQAPTGKLDVVVHPPRGTIVAPLILVPTGALIVAFGYALTRTEASDCVVSTIGSCGAVEHPDATAGLALGLGGAIVVATGVALWFWVRTGSWVDVSDPSGDSFVIGADGVGARF